MKKASLFIVSILLIIPFSVLAADPKVLTVTAENSGSSISYTGTTEDGVDAVMCKLYSSNDEEADKLSSSVVNNSFEGGFSDVANGTYTVACAKYEGGEVVSAEVTVENSTTSNDESTTTGSDSKTTTSNPKTYDAGITNSIILFAICLAGAIGSAIYLKKKKVNE